ncbi:ABC-F family ATP-binding cassette domain-containing protein [Spongiibacter sp.]|uniref:ABC-F family ATP-binding cassette domain-containing protein n=1 Tax=Spongiibacter sp. TaxID=2024860 RepID=UPI000C695121|nr:ABC-F family ATP-binding cassette domain-containing protein [Spongiibacter sp.]MBU72115.1 ABC transporter ATP-binding protein [Spongiibacter sp.]
MTKRFLTLDNVSYTLPDGRALFSQLNAQFDQQPTGLVGRNGVGKSLLARILAGQLTPSSGHCKASGPVYYLPQQLAPTAGSTVADLAGVQPVLSALERIEQGSAAEKDFDALGEHWDIRQRLHAALENAGLPGLSPNSPADTLSGGEAMRVALAGAMLSAADFLILDEPSNHLDRPSRQALVEQLQQWSRGLIVISHDRELLNTLGRIVELSPSGLRSYGGNYAFYAECKANERQAAQQQLEHCKLERRREEQAMREQRDRQAHRQARGKQTRREGSQAKILLDAQQQRSENFSGKAQRQQAARQTILRENLHNAQQQLEREAEIVMHAPPTPMATPRRVLTLENLVLPFGGCSAPITLSLTSAQRVAVVGANGSGKSTLLKVIAGQLQALSGHCQHSGKLAYLDQRLTTLDPSQTVLTQIQAANPDTPESQLRMQLAQLDLDAQKITAPSGTLSGGEQLKAALACLLYAALPPALLLLDEPSNHLDLPSLIALETMLRAYRGSLITVSHDEAFLNALGLTHRLSLEPPGISLSAW